MVRDGGSPASRLALTAAGVVVGGCSADVFDVDVALTARTFVADFGTQSGTIPTVDVHR